MGKFKHISGEKINRLTLVSFIKGDIKQGISSKWLCRCECGNECMVQTTNFKRQKSCGCYYEDNKHEFSKTHGMTRKIPEYAAWINLKCRCYDVNNPSYKHYGERGIIVCERWLISFENFIKDMGRKPTSKHSIERNDVNGNYEPSNCRWATAKEQARNIRTNKIYTYNGETAHVSDFIPRMSISKATFYRRLKNHSFEYLADNFLIK